MIILERYHRSTVSKLGIRVSLVLTFKVKVKGQGQLKVKVIPASTFAICYETHLLEPYFSHYVHTYTEL